MSHTDRGRLHIKHYVCLISSELHVGDFSQSAEYLVHLQIRLLILKR